MSFFISCLDTRSIIKSWYILYYFLKLYDSLYWVFLIWIFWWFLDMKVHVLFGICIFFLLLICIWHFRSFIFWFEDWFVCFWSKYWILLVFVVLKMFKIVDLSRFFLKFGFLLSFRLHLFLFFSQISW